jgi:hypothetical protein
MPEQLATAQLLVSFAGGGLMAVLVVWLKEKLTGDKQREIACLEESLRLYAPLHFLTLCNDQLLRLHGNAQDAMDAEFTSERATQQRAGNEAAITAAIRLLNDYTALFEPNNTRMAEAIEANWRLVDADDVELFADFLAQRYRIRVEVPLGQLAPDLLGVRLRLGAPTIIDPAFGIGVKAKFEAKRARLQALRRSSALAMGAWWRKAKPAVLAMLPFAERPRSDAQAEK